MAESSFTFSSILSKYAPTNTTSASVPAPLPVTTSSAISRPQPQSRMTAVGQARPTGSTSSASAINSRISLATPGTNATRLSTNGNTDNAVKKRKLENPVENRPLTETDKERAERKKMLLERIKLKKEKNAAMSGSMVKGAPASPHGSKPSRPSSTGFRDRPTPAASEYKKMTYADMLARAAKLQDEKKNLGAITHKARAPVVEKKEWQKKLEARHQPKASGLAADRKSKSPGIPSGGERGGGLISKKTSGRDTGKMAPVKRTGDTESRKSSTTKGNPLDKSRLTGTPVKRKRSPSPTDWRGKNAIVKKSNRPRPGRSRYDEDEEDDWIVDDDDEGPRGKRSGYGQRYRYAESDFESDSDMEAAGIDILEEEERSRRNAIREDNEQEKLEKELAAKKAAMKKKLGKK